MSMDQQFAMRSRTLSISTDFFQVEFSACLSFSCHLFCVFFFKNTEKYLFHGFLFKRSLSFGTFLLCAFFRVWRSHIAVLSNQCVSNITGSQDNFNCAGARIVIIPIEFVITWNMKDKSNNNNNKKQLKLIGGTLRLIWVCLFFPQSLVSYQGN